MPAATCPICAHKVARGRGAGRVRPGELRRPRAAQRARELSRATSCSRSTRRRSTGSPSTICNLSERPRIRALARVDEFDRFVSVLVFIPKDRYDTRRAPPRRRRSWRRSIGGASRPPIRPIRKARSRAPTTSSAATKAPRRGRSRDAGSGASRRSSAPGATACATRWTRRSAARRPARSRRRYAEAFSAAYREAFTAEQAIADIDILRASLRGAPARRRSLPPRAAMATDASTSRCSRAARALPLSERVPLLENLGFQVVNERTYRIAPAGASEARARLAARHDPGARRRRHRSTSPRSRIRSRRRSWPCSAGSPNPTASTASCSKPGSAGATSPWCGRSGATCARSASPTAQNYLAATLARHGAIAATDRRACSTRASTRAPRADAPRPKPRCAPRSRSCSRRSRASTRTASCAASSTSSRRRCAPTSSRLDAQRPAAPDDRLQVRCAGDRRPAAAAGRSTRSSSIRPRVEGVHLRFGTVARGGLRWSDRPQDFRTEVLGPRQGAAGQERRHRAGRRQGRLLPEAAAAGRRPRRPGSPRAPRATSIFVRTLLDLTDNIDGDRVVPPPDTVRHDGDDPYLVVAADKGTATFSDIANAHLGRDTASGSATPSPPAAARATTTRRWASPRAAPGRR